MVSEPHIMVVGSSMIDMISYLDRFPLAGETVRGRSFSLGFGGKGANQAVMAALLGGRVSMVACVGDDVFADLVVENFREAGVDGSCVVRREKTSSGVAPIWVEPNGENRIVIAPGANEHLRPEDVDAAFDRLPRPDVVLCQLEIAQDTVLRAFERGRAVGATTILNPAPAAAVDARIIELTTWLVPNEREFAEIQSYLGGSRDTEDVETSVRKIAEQWNVGLVVTAGADGAFLYSEELEAVGKLGVAAVGAADTTGAGDAFVGSFAYGVAAGLSPVRAVQLGGACASSSVTRLGTQSSFPRGAELESIVSVWRGSAHGQAIVGR